MKKKQKAALLLSFIGSLALCNNASALNLNETLEQTYKNNETINAKRYQVKTVKSNKNLAISGFMPTVEANFQRGEKDIEYSPSAMGTDSKTDIENDSISLSQPIIKSGRTILEIGARQNLLKAARGDLLSTEQQIHTEAIFAYTEILKTQEILQLSKDREESLKRSYEYALARFRVGEATKTEVETANARYARSKSETVISRNNLKKADENFIKIVGLDAANLEKLDYKNYDLKTNNLNIKEEIVNNAIRNNPSIQVAEYNHKSNKLYKRKSKAEFFPELTFDASKSKYADYSTSSSVYYDIDDTRYSLNLKVPLFQAGTEYFGAAKANSEYNQSKYNLTLAKKEVKESAINAYNNLQASKAVVESEIANVRAASLALESIQEEERLGLKTIIDVLDSKRDFYDAEEGRINAEYAQIRSFYQLELVQGKLTGEGLGFEKIKI